MKAFDVLHELIARMFVIERWKARPGNMGKPGEMVEKLSPEERQELSNLTSQELGKTMEPEIGYFIGDKYHRQHDQKKRITDEKMKFDRLIKK